MREKELDSIQRQIKELQDKAAAIVSEDRENALEPLKATIAKYGFTAVELGVRTKARKTKPRAEPKWANPNNPEETWAGVTGRLPNWIKDGFLKKDGTVDIDRLKPIQRAGTA